MPYRVCLVTPFDWSQPNDVNDHVKGLADALRERDCVVTVIAPSSRSADLVAGRHELAHIGARDERPPNLLVIGPAVPVTPRTRLGLPVGIRANLAQALAQGRYDIVHGFDPATPSISYLALLEARSLTAATFGSADRISFPTRKQQRERLLGRIDALLATAPAVAAAAAERFSGDYRIVSPGVDSSLFAPGIKRKLVVIELAPGGGSAVRAGLRILRGLDDWEVVVLRDSALTPRPATPKAMRGRVHVRTRLGAAARAALLGEAAIVVPAIGGSDRLRLEASAAGCALVERDGTPADADSLGEALLSLIQDDAGRDAAGARAKAAAEGSSFVDLAKAHDELYAELLERRRPRNRGSDPLSNRDLITVDLHMHTRWSHDCSTDVAELIDHAEEIGLGAIAITDHNVFGGALEAVEVAAGRTLVVIPGEEVKTDTQGEVIGLFLREEIPRGMSFADTVAAIREQEGIVYVPHPFDRLHSIPGPATLHRHLGEIDVLEVYNARLLRDAFNDEALRFARKYGLLAGAGSDAHVLQGVGTGALRMRRFEGPEEFLISLRSAEVLRRPKSLAYLQSLKWVAQVKEKVL